MYKRTIGYVSAVNPFEDRKAWSGSIYKIREAISDAGFEVIWIPYKNNTVRVRMWNRIFRLYHKLTHKNLAYGIFFRPLVKEYAKSIRNNPDIEKCDFIFFPGFAHISEYCKIDKPIVFFSDASAFNMIDYYWKNCPKWYIKMSEELEYNAINRALINIRSSQWAADSIIKDGHFNADDTYVLEFGPNIDIADIKRVTPYKDGELRILFSGVEWERKGGDIAVDAVRILREKGIDAKLYIAGIQELPDYCQKYDFIVNIGFLNKNIPEQYAEYIKMWKNMHLFLLPTKAECSAIVFCEASAFGMPSYTYATGGVPNYVVDGVNGRTCRLGEGPEVFAQKIYDDVTSGNLNKLYEGTRNISESKLSWEAWSRRFHEIMSKY